MKESVFFYDTFDLLEFDFATPLLATYNSVSLFPSMLTTANLTNSEHSVKQK